MGFRTSIEDLERLLYPDFLFGTKLSRKQKLIIALTLGITRYGRYIRDQIDADPTITVVEVATAIDEFYDKLSLKLGHYQQATVPRTEAQWNETFDFVGARYGYQKKSLRLFLQDIDELPKSGTSRLQGLELGVREIGEIATQECKLERFGSTLGKIHRNLI